MYLEEMEVPHDRFSDSECFKFVRFPVELGRDVKIVKCDRFDSSKLVNFPSAPGRLLNM